MRCDVLLLFAAGLVQTFPLSAETLHLAFGGGDPRIEVPDLADVVGDLPVDVGDLALPLGEACVGIVKPRVESVESLHDRGEFGLRVFGAVQAESADQGTEREKAQGVVRWGPATCRRTGHWLAASAGARTSSSDSAVISAGWGSPISDSRVGATLDRVPVRATKRMSNGPA